MLKSLSPPQGGDKPRDRRHEVSRRSSTSKARPCRSLRISWTSCTGFRPFRGRWPGGRPGRSGQTRCGLRRWVLRFARRGFFLRRAQRRGAPASGQNALHAPAGRRAPRQALRTVGRAAPRRPDRRATAAAAGDAGRRRRAPRCAAPRVAAQICGAGGNSFSADRAAAGSGSADARRGRRGRLRPAWPRRPPRNLGLRQHDGDAEAAQGGFHRHEHGLARARRRQGHDQTTRGDDDQPPHGGFGRA